MAYEAPTPTTLKARYPAFAAVEDATIDYWLTDSLRFVDSSWIEDDRAPAMMALAAHQMALSGIGTQSGAAALPAGVTRFRSASMDVSVSESAASAAAKGGYGSTRYGLEFQALQRRSFGGPRVIAAGRVPVGIPGGSIICGDP